MRININRSLLFFHEFIKGPRTVEVNEFDREAVSFLCLRDTMAASIF